MSTLPFLLSVADELDNLNSQSYMDDFGLGFHPHRQYYRSPTIQLSLPASTEWMTERQRYRSHKFYEGSRHNYQATEEDEEHEPEPASEVSYKSSDNQDETQNKASYIDKYGDRHFTNKNSNAAAKASQEALAQSANNANLSKKMSSQGASVSLDSCQKYAMGKPGGRGAIMAPKQHSLNTTDADDDIDNTVRMYNLSKKCCKNYYRHAAEIGEKGNEKCSGSSSSTASTTHDSYKFNSKCIDGNYSSSEESLQKVSSPIEFLTCFLVKKSRSTKPNVNANASTPTPTTPIPMSTSTLSAIATVTSSEGAVGGVEAGLGSSTANTTTAPSICSSSGSKKS